MERCPDHLINGELFETLKEAQIVIERWRIHDHTVKPYSPLVGKPPAPKASQLAS
jgi:putative transposase